MRISTGMGSPSEICSPPGGQAIPFSSAYWRARFSGR